MTELYTIQNLFKNHLYLDITEQFQKTLDAILFLENPGEEAFSSNFSIVTTNLINDNDISTPFNKNNMDLKKSSEITSNLTDYNIADILLLKLIENHKRLYAFNKNTYINMKNEDSLKEQQDNIFSVFSKLDSLLVFDTKNKLYQKSIFGKDKNLFPLEMLTYLLLSEQLQPSNFLKGFDLLKKHVTETNFQYSPSFIHLLTLYIHKPDKKEYLQFILEHSDLQNLFDSVFTFQSSFGWKIIASNFLLKEQNNHLLNQKQQFNLTKEVFSTLLLNSQFFKIYLNDEEQKDYKDNIISMIKKFSSDRREALFAKNISFNPKKNNEDIQTSVSFKIIDNTTNPSFFIQALNFNKKHPEYSSKIFSLYNLEDQDTTYKILDKINRYPHTQRLDMMKDFISIIGTSLNKKTLSYILSMNSDYIDLLNPVYLKIKVNENVNKQNHGSPQPSRKMKL